MWVEIPVFKEEETEKIKVLLPADNEGITSPKEARMSRVGERKLKGRRIDPEKLDHKEQRRNLGRR